METTKKMKRLIVIWCNGKIPKIIESILPTKMKVNMRNDFDYGTKSMLCVSYKKSFRIKNWVKAIKIRANGVTVEGSK